LNLSGARESAIGFPIFVLEINPALGIEKVRRRCRRVPFLDADR
jgi:hypothetical protein